MTANKRATAATVALVLFAPLAAAQSSLPLVPSVLVRAVHARNVPYNVDARFTVGTLPKGWPSALKAQRPATLIGGGTLGNVTTALYRYPVRIDGIAQLTSQLIRLRYTQGTEVRADPNPFRGFIALDSPAPEHIFCSDSDLVVLRMVDSTRQYRMISIAQMPFARGRGCDKDPPPEVRPALVFPVLLPPPGVTATREPVSYTTRNEESSVRLDSTLSVDAILTHYAGELRRGGWQATRIGGSTNRTGMLEITARDAKNDEWHGVLVVVTGVAERLVHLRMMRDRN